MTPGRCRGCRRTLPAGSPSYCSTTCLELAMARRRAVGAERARRRRSRANHPASADKETM